MPTYKPHTSEVIAVNHIYSYPHVQAVPRQELLQVPEEKDSVPGT